MGGSSLFVLPAELMFEVRVGGELGLKRFDFREDNVALMVRDLAHEDCGNLGTFRPVFVFNAEIQFRRC